MAYSSFSIHVRNSLLGLFSLCSVYTHFPDTWAAVEQKSAEVLWCFKGKFNFLPQKTHLCPDHLSWVLIWLRTLRCWSQYFKTDNYFFLLRYKIFTDVKAGLKIARLFLLLFFFFSSLVLPCGRTFTFSLSMPEHGLWVGSLLNLIRSFLFFFFFRFPLLANFPDNWSRMQTQRERTREREREKERRRRVWGWRKSMTVRLCPL